jgi:peroxiredoxin Q/BCP
MLAVGAHAPAFELPDHASQLVSLADLLASGPAVVFFYPGDFTPICTREACMVRDVHAELAAAGVSVAGISPDAPGKHAEFRERYALDYRLLADERKEVAALYGATGPLGFGVRRVSYLISAAGLIGDRLCADFKVARHAAFLRRVLNA